MNFNFDHSYTVENWKLLAVVIVAATLQKMTLTIGEHAYSLDGWWLTLAVIAIGLPFAISRDRSEAAGDVEGST